MSEKRKMTTRPDLSIVIFLNPDTVVPEGSLEEMVRFLEHHPTTGMVGPELPDGRDKLLFNWSRLSVRGVA